MNKEKIKKILLNENNKKIFSHILICNNKNNNYFIEYVSRDYDIDEYIGYLYKKYCNDIFKIEECYNFNLDLEKQLAEEKPNHREKVRRKNAEKYPELMSKSELALMFATKKHEGQKINKDIEYISHPINVANIIKKYINSSDYEDYITVSYLHDTLKYTNTTFEELTNIFGLKIAFLVKELTSDYDIEKELGKIKYLSIKLKKMHDEALIIKLCDILDNLSYLYNLDNDIKNRYIKEIISIIEYLIDNRDLNFIHIKIIKDIIELLSIIVKYNYDETNMNEINVLNYKLTKKEVV